jgi:FixJ family two-component response regulator
MKQPTQTPDRGIPSLWYSSAKPGVISSSIGLQRSIMMTFVRGLAKFVRGIEAWRGKQHGANLSVERGLPLVAVLGGDMAGYGDRATLSEAAEHARWDLQVANSCEEAWHLADQRRAAVILYDRDIQETEWREAVGILSALAHRPMVILISRVADEYLWNELFRIGGFDILRKPLRVDEVERVLTLALSYWRSECARVEKGEVEKRQTEKGEAEKRENVSRAG